MKIPLKSRETAHDMFCPFFLNPQGHPLTCKAYDCMAWTIVQKEISREDHDGGKHYIQRLANLYGVEAERKGPPGSTGYWLIPDLGYCKRLWPNAPVVSFVDYEPNKPESWEG